MKKFLLLFLLWIKSSSESRSQTTDTICLPVTAAKKILIAAEQKKSLDSLVSVYRSDINILQSQVGLLQEKDRNHAQIEAAYRGQVDILNREVRKLRRKSIWAAAGGIILSGITAFLFITK